MGTHPIFESDFDCLTDEMVFEIVPFFVLFIRVTISQNLFLQAENGRSDVFDVDECGNSFSCIKFHDCEIEENRCAVAAWVSFANFIEFLVNLIEFLANWLDNRLFLIPRFLKRFWLRIGVSIAWPKWYSPKGVDNRGGLGHVRGHIILRLSFYFLESSTFFLPGLLS